MATKKDQNSDSNENYSDEELRTGIFQYLSGEKKVDEARQQIPKSTFSAQSIKVANALWPKEETTTVTDDTTKPPPKRTAHEFRKEMMKPSHERTQILQTIDLKKEINQLVQAKRGYGRKDKINPNKKPKTDKERMQELRDRKMEDLEKLSTATKKKEGGKKPNPEYISIQFIKSASMKEEARKFETYLTTLKPTKTKQSYADKDRNPGEINPTDYSIWFFAEDQQKKEIFNEWDDNKTKLRVLGDSDMGEKLGSFVPYNDILNSVRTTTLRTPSVAKNKKFRYIAGRNITEDIPCVLEEERITNMSPEKLFKGQFCTAEAHQSTKPNDDIVFYPQHKDKVGNLVIFWQTSGLSYNFIVYPRETPVSDEDKTEYGIEKERTSSWEDYDKFRKSLVDKDSHAALKRLKIFETTLNTKNGKGNFGIRVYKMTEGDRLIFPAKYYKHGTILPPQDTRRTIVIFFRMESQSSRIGLVPPPEVTSPSARDFQPPQVCTGK